MSKKVLHVAEVRRAEAPFFPFFFDGLTSVPETEAQCGGRHRQRVGRQPRPKGLSPALFYLSLSLFPSFSHCGRQRKGKSVYNPLFEFQYNWRGGVARKFVVTR